MAFALGVSMVVLLFAAIFFVVAYIDSVYDAVCVFGLTAGIVVWVYLASYLMAT